ncbi:hypothetical protein ETD83_28180 [Actinomadura soli]|uniref:Uncharacterized protein n=1 Tax=Actinomadura soli TaxID=2508997 RepID=A0A5C4J525_9ACTN|nr:hypothetical protein [Actinomadura soli]TMQ92072.1 hypothetical protein ETD83_28180 [Actinomadura soli]
MKIFTYSEEHEREHSLEWDVLLAPHHCSKKVMFLPRTARTCCSRTSWTPSLGTPAMRPSSSPAVK